MAIGLKLVSDLLIGIIITILMIFIGVNLNLMAKHPLTGDEIPVYVADYVVSNYGSQAIMGMCLLYYN